MFHLVIFLNADSQFRHRVHITRRCGIRHDGGLGNWDGLLNGLDWSGRLGTKF
jgi:hypothetical protein